MAVKAEQQSILMHTYKVQYYEGAVELQTNVDTSESSLLFPPVEARPCQLDELMPTAKSDTSASHNRVFLAFGVSGIKAEEVYPCSANSRCTAT